MDTEGNVQSFIVWCRDISSDVMRLDRPDNLLCRKIDRVEISQSQQAAKITISLDDGGNIVAEVFYMTINNHQPWCMVSLRPGDCQPLILTSSHCVLTLRLHDSLNELIISPDYGWDV